MGEVIHVKNSSYSRYEELLIRKDNAKKEAFYWDREYVKVFGDKILKLFELKLECIKKKKTISYCQAIYNHGGKVNQEKLQKYLEKELAEYNAQLEFMIKDNNAAKASQKISQRDILEIKKTYRKLAKLIHPDINPKTNEVTELQELWERIAIAYKCNNLEDLRELEILVTAVLEKLGEGVVEIEIPNIDEKISKIEEEIKKIYNTDPYLYKFILDDEAAVKEKNAALDEEFASYEDYGKQLDEILEELMISGVTFTWQVD